VRKFVLRRDNHVCQVVPGCLDEGNVCDHIVPVWPGMPDAMFFDPSNLRASCSRHNTARGGEETMARERAPVDRPTRVVTKDYTR
jgi:5-methylcytosine-specific restriction endonuclease McrA